MNKIKLKKNKENLSPFSIGACIKIENSKKIFQIIGINSKKTICWIREWPISANSYKTFELSINKVEFLTTCPQNIIGQ